MSPEILPDDIAALRALVRAVQAERDAERAEKARLIEERDQLTGQNDRLPHRQSGYIGTAMRASARRSPAKRAARARGRPSPPIAAGLPRLIR